MDADKTNAPQQIRENPAGRATTPEKQSILRQLRESAPAQALDKAIEATDHFLGASGKAWLANGLDELRQAVSLGTEQIQGGQNPGLWGTITTGEATAERMGDLTLDDLRVSAAARRSHDPEPSKEKIREHENGRE